MVQKTLDGKKEGFKLEENRHETIKMIQLFAIQFDSGLKTIRSMAFTRCQSLKSSQMVTRTFN